MKAKAKSAKSVKTPKKYPVPEWMDDELKPTAEKLDILQRHEAASKLERQAQQLREMNPPKIRFVEKTELALRPKMKEAILKFADQFGAIDCDEKTSLAFGTRWFLEGALPLIETVVSNTLRMCRYRDAEGLEDSVYSEKLIGDALDEWKPKSAKIKDAEDSE